MKALKISSIIFPLLMLLFSSCTKEETSMTEDFMTPSQALGCPVLSLDTYAHLGQIHNDGLSNVLDNFTIDPDVSTVDEAVDQLAEFNLTFVQEHFDASMADHLTSEMESYKRFVVQSEAYDNIYSETSPTNIYSLNEMALSNNLIDEAEKGILDQIAVLGEQNYNGEIDQYVLQSELELLKQDWESRGYTVCSSHGNLSAIALSISLASVQWWIDNDGAGNNELQLPVFVAVDAVGAVVGAVSSAGLQQGFNGSINWGIVGGSAVISGVVASTGAIGKIGSWLAKLI